MHMQVCLHRHAPSFVLVNTYITIITSYNNRHSIKTMMILMRILIETSWNTNSRYKTISIRLPIHVPNAKKDLRCSSVEKKSPANLFRGNIITSAIYEGDKSGVEGHQYTSHRSCSQKSEGWCHSWNSKTKNRHCEMKWPLCSNLET